VSSRAPAPIRKLRDESAPKNIFLDLSVEAKKPNVEAKKISTDRKVHPDGFIPAVRKMPSGTEVRRYPRRGIRLRCFGSEITMIHNSETARIELKILMLIIELATSELAIQLIVQ
jgi:hypothetical protein